MHLGFSPEDDIAWCEEGCRSAGIGCVDCKKRLAKNMSETLSPVREKYWQYEDDPDYVTDVIHEGAKKCKARAEQTMQEVREKTGLRDPSV
jgi:tryptophanyl-tRNA synthetase